MVVMVGKGEVNRRSGLESPSEGTITCAWNYSGGVPISSRTLVVINTRPCPISIFPCSTVTLCGWQMAVMVPCAFDIHLVAKSTAHPPIKDLRQAMTHPKLCGAPSISDSESDVASCLVGQPGIQQKVRYSHSSRFLDCLYDHGYVWMASTLRQRLLECCWSKP